MVDIINEVDMDSDPEIEVIEQIIRKTPEDFASTQRNSPTFEEFLLSNCETIESSSQTVANDCNTSTSPKTKRTAHSVRPEPQHVSRHWHYIHPQEDKEIPQHKSVLEAPFVRMKEIHVNPPRHPIREDSKKFRLAEHKKEEGNKLYKQKKYNEALKQYSAAIDLCPNIASYYGNRSACYMMVGQHKAALDDVKRATELDNTFIKGYLRAAKCHLLLGDTKAAARSLERVKALEPNNTELTHEKRKIEFLEKFMNEIDRYIDKKDYRSALYNAKKALEMATESSDLKLKKAECLVLLGNNSDAQEIVNDIMRFDRLNADAIYIRGMSLYYTDNVEKAFQHFQQVLVFNPEHKKAKTIFKMAKQLMAKKQEGNDAIKNHRLEDAINIYTSALSIDPLNKLTNAKIFFNRSIAYAKSNKVKEAIDDCSSAIQLDDTYIKAYLKRAKLYLDSELYDESVRDYDTVYKKDKTREHKQLLENAKLELKKSKRKDYYKLLGVRKDATEDEIKKAYKKRALIHHPDRHTSAPENEQKEQEKKFKEVGEAYAVLTDPKKRSRYDNGVDLDGNGMDGFDVDPTNLFQAFWSTGAPGGFSQSQGPFHYSFSNGGQPSGGQHHGFSFNNFPF